MTEEKVNVILDAAYHLFGTKGFYETKISEIAEHAGIAKGTVYLYFSSKEELFKSMTARDFERFLEQLEARLSELDNFERKLRIIAEHHLNYFYECKEYTKIFFQAPNNDPELMEIMAKYLQQYILSIVKVMNDKGLKDPAFKAKAFAGILDGIKMDILFSNEFKREDILPRVEFTINLFLKGCYA